MKKVLTATLLLLLLAGCSSQGRWDREQRREMRRMLSHYRTAPYTGNMSDPEFALFAESVTDNLEERHPDYKRLIAMPGAADTIDAVVVSTISTELAADAHNMRFLFPYEELVGSNLLPAGLSREQLRAYYTCLAEKINGRFGSYDAFVTWARAHTLDVPEIRELQRGCTASFATGVAR